MAEALIVPVILAGGGGTRLWPLSRGHYPKQFLAVQGDQSLLQQTMLRLEGLQDGSSVSAPVVVCNEEHRFMVAEQAREIGVNLRGQLLEPIGRNTAPALTCAALQIAADQNDGDDAAAMIMMPADHLIAKLPVFHQAVQLGREHASDGAIVTFGVVPDKPETGYGYIKVGTALALTAGDLEAPAAHGLEAFVEKPDLRRAREYVHAGNYLWNSGIFMMRVDVWLAEIERLQPEMLAACRRALAEAEADGPFTRLGHDAFAACPADSIDYAVMEHLPESGDPAGIVVSLDAGWSDVGSWASLWEVSDKDSAGNVVAGDVGLIDARDNLVHADHRLVTVLGCRGLVVAETADAVMIADREQSQDVKRIVTWLEEGGRQERLTHRRRYSAWGSMEEIDAGPGFRVNRVSVKPGAALRMQLHMHRAEHWIIVSGTARVTCGDRVSLLAENQSMYIPIGQKHKLENPGSIPLELVEVQSGSYIGEDDIVRFDDDD
ncbi:MAG: mannose-1-phosphate guanylyltransferase/mannose-6-phosphate isomerase [Gammaproteobacteria bacterium]|nr:mannose-1-phosphate guanylyltransferase/mannose-6-phosphate isomerase [Gammaproteobacteria bacterium]NNL99704.1 mannose-1-phosphate guanylyltransferase/mannose-6-phosphate isomerase [Gammaproteobacteria bacterium]